MGLRSVLRSFKRRWEVVWRCTNRYAHYRGGSVLEWFRLEKYSTTFCLWYVPGDVSDICSVREKSSSEDRCGNISAKSV